MAETLRHLSQLTARIQQPEAAFALRNKMLQEYAAYENDSAYGLIQWKQNDRFGHANMTAFTNPDFVRLAESMGCKGYRIRHADELCEILEDAFRQEVPVVIDCPVDYRENTLLTQRLKTIMDEHRT